MTIFVALIALVVLPKQPGSAWFLSHEERKFGSERMRIDNERYVLSEYGSTNIEEVSQRLTMRDVIETAKDWKLWTVLVCNICASVPSQAFGIFLPVVVQGMGFSSNQANLVRNPTRSDALRPTILTEIQMSVPPFVCGAIGLYLVTFSSDHL